jgi:hypothetical protein
MCTLYSGKYITNYTTEVIQQSHSVLQFSQAFLRSNNFTSIYRIWSVSEVRRHTDKFPPQETKSHFSFYRQIQEYQRLMQTTSFIVYIIIGQANTGNASSNPNHSIKFVYIFHPWLSPIHHHNPHVRVLPQTDNPFIRNSVKNPNKFLHGLGKPGIWKKMKNWRGWEEFCLNHSFYS